MKPQYDSTCDTTVQTETVFVASPRFDRAGTPVASDIPQTGLFSHEYTRGDLHRECGIPVPAHSSWLMQKSCTLLQDIP